MLMFWKGDSVASGANQTERRKMGVEDTSTCIFRNSAIELTSYWVRSRSFEDKMK